MSYGQTIKMIFDRMYIVLEAHESMQDFYSYFRRVGQDAFEIVLIELNNDNNNHRMFILNKAMAVDEHLDARAIQHFTWHIMSFLFMLSKLFRCNDELFASSVARVVDIEGSSQIFRSIGKYSHCMQSSRMMEEIMVGVINKMVLDQSIAKIYQCSLTYDADVKRIAAQHDIDMRNLMFERDKAIAGNDRLESAMRVLEEEHDRSKRELVRFHKEFHRVNKELQGSNKDVERLINKAQQSKDELKWLDDKLDRCRRHEELDKTKIQNLECNMDQCRNTIATLERKNSTLWTQISSKSKMPTNQTNHEDVVTYSTEVQTDDVDCSQVLLLQSPVEKTIKRRRPSECLDDSILDMQSDKANLDVENRRLRKEIDDLQLLLSAFESGPGVKTRKSKCVIKLER